MDIAQLAEALAPYIIEQRRTFHRHPELSWQEAATTAAIAGELEAMGVQVRLFAHHTGLVGTLHGTRPAPAARTVLLRADLDALPIAEATGLPFASENPGVMHACGHDCHAAMLLGAARILSEHRDAFAGEIRLLFQPAEEISEGAPYCLSQGVLDGVDAVFGLHVWGDLDAPLLSIAPGARMASCDNFTLTVHGVAAHGSAPHQGVDAIVAACAIVTQLQALVARFTNPRDPLVLTIGEFHGGQRFNIIANQAELKGTVRAYNPEVRAQVEGQLRRMAEHTALAYGATATLTYEYLAPPVINAPDSLVSLARNAAVRLYGEQALGEMAPLMSSEDFACYLEHTPGVFCFLGSRNAALGHTACNHNDGFTVDEAALPRGAALYAQFACDFLSAGV